MKFIKKLCNYFMKKEKTLHKKNKSKEKLNLRLHEIEKILKDLTEKDREITINIEEIRIDNPAIDSIIFELDKIDVKELKGTLNIGFICGSEKSTPANFKKLKGKIRKNTDSTKTKNTNGNHNKNQQGKKSFTEDINNRDKIKTTSYINNISTK